MPDRSRAGDDDIRERVRRRMTEEGIPVGSDVPEAQALGAPPLHLIVQCVCGRQKQQGFICDFCYSTEDSRG